MEREERIIHGSLLGGFLCTEIAWYQAIYNINVILHWEQLMQLAGVLWLIGFGTLYWYKRERILQEEIPGFPPWYFFLLGVPMGIYAAISPWFLLTVLSAIRAPAIAT